MNRWLKKIQNTQVDTPLKPREAPLRGLGGVVTDAFEEKTKSATVPDWVEWIADQLPLLREDKEYVWARLATLPPLAMEKAARRYVETWVTAAGAEPKSHRKENAGRRAANRTLLALITPASWRHRR